MESPDSRHKKCWFCFEKPQDGWYSFCNECRKKYITFEDIKSGWEWIDNRVGPILEIYIGSHFVHTMSPKEFITKIVGD